jgi:uncharacterized protein with HEPN domain
MIDVSSVGTNVSKTRSDSTLQRASIRSLEVIGEATKRLSLP